MDPLTLLSPRTVGAFVKFASTQRILILGTGDLAKDLCQALISKKRPLVSVVGFLDQNPKRVGERLVNPGIIGTMDQVLTLVEKHRINKIAVCLEDRRAVLPVQALLDVMALGVEVVDGHYLFEHATKRMSIDRLRPSAFIFSHEFRYKSLTRAFKRGFDVGASLLGLLCLLPMFFVLGIFIKLDSPGPIFYRQLRVGMRGRPFWVWKLRSMKTDAEVEGPQWASRNDPRITGLGSWLRTWRIDELPQLVNVLKGEMSLVGPRPERPIFVQELRTLMPYYDLRHNVRPGITGWAQIRYHYAASAEDSHFKLQYDLYYVKNLSLGLDIRILFETINVAFRGHGAR